MKKIGRLFLISLVTLGFHTQAAGAKDAPISDYLTGALDGMHALGNQVNVADFSVIDSVDEDGVSLATLGEKKGKVLIVTFWSRRCLLCRSYLKELEALQTDLGSEEFEVVAINIGRDSHQYTENWLARQGVTHLAAYTHFHHSIVNELNANPWFRFYGEEPRSLLVDATGNVVAYSSVTRDWATPEGKALLASLMP